MTRIKVTEVKSTFAKIKGLLGTNKPFPLFLKTRFGIHTFGMRYPIDVVILDDSFRVQTIKQNLLPNRIFLWNPLFKNVLELPSGIIRKEKIQREDKIQVIFEEI